MYAVVIAKDDGTTVTRKYVAPPFLEGIDIGEQFSVGRLRAGTFLDAIAFMHTKDEQDWWIIAMASDILDVLAVEDGDSVVLPGLDVMKDLIK
jgi:hypothetical protein